MKPPDPSNMTPAELFDRLEDYEFECPGGPLANADEWIELRRRLSFLAAIGPMAPGGYGVTLQPKAYRAGCIGSNV